MSAANRIRIQSTPPGPPQVFVEHGAQTRAMAGALVFGGLLTTLLVALSRRLRTDADAGTEADAAGDADYGAGNGGGGSASCPGPPTRSWCRATGFTSDERRTPARSGAAR